MGQLHILDRTGDTMLEWDTDTEDDVRETFDRLIEQGFVGYRLDGEDGGEVIRTFDPTAQTVILRPALVGG